MKSSIYLIVACLLSSGKQIFVPAICHQTHLGEKYANKSGVQAAPTKREEEGWRWKDVDLKDCKLLCLAE